MTELETLRSENKRLLTALEKIERLLIYAPTDAQIAEAWLTAERAALASFAASREPVYGPTD